MKKLSAMVSASATEGQRIAALDKMLSRLIRRRDAREAVAKGEDRDAYSEQHNAISEGEADSISFDG